MRSKIIKNLNGTNIQYVKLKIQYFLTAKFKLKLKYIIKVQKNKYLI